jgi:D-alanine-D-alanine ligase
MLGQLDEGLPPGTVVFPVLHGPFGEDGVIQGHLETLNLAYVGAGVLSSAICMDKGVAKSVLHDHGLPVAAWRVTSRAQWSAEEMKEAVGALGLPMFVKPANLGSSIGVAKVFDAAGLGDAVLSAFEFDDHVILEEFIRGRELELALIGNEEVRVSQAGEIIASREFYDYDDKYVLGTAETVAPTDLEDTQLAHAQRVASAAYRALRVEGLARVDLFLADDDEIFVNEVNTMPGFTPISMFPMLWEVEGLPFASVVEELVTLARARHARRRLLRTHRLVPEL